MTDKPKAGELPAMNCGRCDSIAKQEDGGFWTCPDRTCEGSWSSARLDFWNQAQRKMRVDPTARPTLFGSLCSELGLPQDADEWLILQRVREHAQGYRAALSAQQATRDGFVLVPKEPTKAMRNAGYDVKPNASGAAGIRDIWAAMIYAAPVQGAERGEVGQFYYVAFEHSSRESMLFWKPDSRGYTYDVEQAGLYDKPLSEEIEDHLSVPVEFIRSLSAKRTIEYMTRHRLLNSLAALSTEGKS